MIPSSTGAPRRLLAPLRVCAASGCAERVRPTPQNRGRCATHATQQNKRYRSADVTALYNSAMWKRRRRAYLAASTLCLDCLPTVTIATEVHHVVPHRGDPVLFWDETQWRGLCASCHSTHTAREMREGTRW